MSRTINQIPVSELPFIDSRTELPVSERKRLGLILPCGHVNDYRMERMMGRGGSSTEETWVREGPSRDHKGHHTCCGSKVNWRHKVSCPGLDFAEEQPHEG